MVHERQRGVADTGAETQDTHIQPDELASVARRGLRWALDTEAETQDTHLQPDELASVARRHQRWSMSYTETETQDTHLQPDELVVRRLLPWGLGSHGRPADLSRAYVARISWAPC